MRIAICEDEQYFREQLQKELNTYYKSLDVLVCSFSSGEDLLKRMEQSEAFFDLIFMDIEMPGMDGLETSTQIHNTHPDLPIILLTSHKELAMAGYEVDAFRFLDKPLKREKLYQALQAVEKQRYVKKKITIMENGNERYLSCQDILFIKSENVYLKIVTNHQQYLIRKKLKEQERELPQALFCKVHRSYMVNLSYVSVFDGRSITMKNGEQIPVSRNCRDVFKERMLHYIRAVAE